MARVRFLLLALIGLLWASSVHAQNIRLDDGTIGVKAVIYNQDGTEATVGGGPGGSGTVDIEIDGVVPATGAGVTGADVLRVDIANDGAVATDINDAASSLANIEDDIQFLRDSAYTVSSNDAIASTRGDQAFCLYQDQDGGAFPDTVTTEGFAKRGACSQYGVTYVQIVSENGATDVSGAILTSTQLIDDTIFADEAAFTYTTSKVQALGAVAESTTDAIADGLVGALTMDTARRLIVAPTPTTYGGLSIYRSIDLDEGTGEVIKSGAGQLYSLWVTNTATATRFIKVYNATSCTMGTGTPVITVGIPGNSSDDVAGQLTAGGVGIEFTTGICFGATTGVADNDTGAPGSNDIIANAFYK